MAFAWRFGHAMHRLAPPRDRRRTSTHGRVTDGVRGPYKLSVSNREEKQRRREALGAVPVSIGP